IADGVLPSPHQRRERRWVLRQQASAVRGVELDALCPERVLDDRGHATLFGELGGPTVIVVGEPFRYRATREQPQVHATHDLRIAQRGGERDSRTGRRG